MLYPLSYWGWGGTSAAVSHRASVGKSTPKPNGALWISWHTATGTPVRRAAAYDASRAHCETVVVTRILVVGPTSTPYDDIAEEVAADLARLARPGVELRYRCTGGGPASIRDVADATEAAPFVVRTVRDAEHEGFDAVIVDCTDDPGVGMARALVSIPVVGPGEAMAAAIDDARPPICHFSGDELRSLEAEVLIQRSLDARTVTLGGTGFSHVADLLVNAHLGLVVLDPLAVALDRCLVLTGRAPAHGTTRRLDSSRDRRIP